MITYIIKTNNIREGEFYCGVTNNIKKRMKEHYKEKKPHWFGFKNRKFFTLTYIIKGNYEKQIKRAGVKLIYMILNNASAS